MKKKILFCMFRFYKGGTEKIAINLMNNLDKEKYDITLITLFADGGYENLLDKDIKKKSLLKKRIRGVSRLLTFIPGHIIYKLLVKDKYDVEIAVGDGITSRIIGSSFNKESKKISWIHMDVLKRGSNMKEFKTKEGRKKFYEPFDKIVCVSNDCKDNFVKKFGCKNKTIVKNNPVIIDEILRKADEELDITLDKEKLNIVTVGRLSKEKGYDRLLRVHKKLIEEGINHNIYIIGEGPDRKELEIYIKENKLINSIYLLGFKSNPYKYMKKMDLFICSSRNEAFSTVLSEAIILGKPILTTECSGTKELLGNSEFGIICNNSENSLYYELKNIIINSHKIQYYSEKALERSKIFDLDRTIKEWEEVIN